MIYRRSNLTKLQSNFGNVYIKICLRFLSDLSSNVKDRKYLKKESNVMHRRMEKAKSGQAILFSHVRRKLGFSKSYLGARER